MKFRLVILAAAASIALASCGTQVPAGSVGVRVNNYGNGAGVQRAPEGTGWHGLGIGENIIVYPTTQHTYPYARSSSEGSQNNEEIQFTDATGLQLTGDVAITVRVNPALAPALYEKYRLDVHQLIDGPVRIATRSAIRTQSRLYTSEQIYQGAESHILQDALATLQHRYEREGIEIIQLDWIGNIRFPDNIMRAINMRTEQLQLAEAARASQTRAEAQANANIAQARGEAESTRIRAEALRANPEILQQMWIERWNGVLPTTQVTGGNSAPLIQLPATGH